MAFYSTLLQQAEDVIAADGGSALCLEAGRTPDIVVGDFDSLAARDAERLAALGVPMQRHPAKKNATDLDLALDTAIERGHTSAVVTACVGGRLDHMLAVLGSLAHHAELDLTILEPDVSGWFIGGKADDNDSLELAGVGSTVSVFALTVGCRVTLEGFRYPLQDAPVPVLATLGVSNVIASEAGACVSVQGGRLLVLSPAAEGHSAAQRTSTGSDAYNPAG